MTETTEKKTVTPLTAFLSRSGYKPTDILVFSNQSRTFVTSNGGKYQLTKNGGIRTLKGPNYPKQPAGE